MMLKYRGVEFCIQGLDNATFRRLNHVLHFHGVHDGDLLSLKDFITFSHKPFNDRALKRRPDGDGAGGISSVGAESCAAVPL